jgi:hypothetical protein
MTLFSEIGTPAESFCHKAIKQLIYKYIPKNDPNIIERSLEKYFQTRRADVYFKYRNGNQVVVEIQNSRITVAELVERTSDYTKKGIYVLWLLNGKGKIVSDPKRPCGQKDIKISPAEHFLHNIYGGRTYYVNVNAHLNRTTITPPFALHFSPSDKNSTDIFSTQFDYYYIRNMTHVKIPNWRLLCVDYRFKLARFYDKNALKILQKKILNFLRVKLKKKCENCQKRFKRLRRCSIDAHCDFHPYKNKNLVKITISHFKEHYGRYMILKALSDLAGNTTIPLQEKFVRRKLK